MGVTEILLIVLGITAYVVGFLLPAGREKEEPEAMKIDEEAIRDVVDKEVKDAKSQIGDIVDETITYAMEKSERAMDRLTNEKMMAVNEYSDTVLTEINKNHKEVVFLYDMLNDKHESLKATVSEAVKAEGEIKQTARDAEITAKEVQERVRQVEESVNEVLEKPEKGEAEDAVYTDDFKPIAAEKVEVIYPTYQPEKEDREEEKNTTVKSKTSRTSKKDLQKEEKAPAAAESAAPGEVLVSLQGESGYEGKNNKERILELHKAGKSNMAIARELGLGLGEVKLVIDLFEGA